MAEEVRARPGGGIRALRRSLDFTLAELSRVAGIPVSTLSRLENDRASPTYDHLVRLSEGLGVDISSLFSAIQGGAVAGKGARRSINRLGDGVAMDSRHSVQKYLSTELVDKEFTPILAEITADSIEDHGAYLRHPGEEFVFVISGTLALYSEAYSPVVLKTGESIYFDSTMAHAYVRIGEQACTVLSICTAPHVLAARPADPAPEPPRSARRTGAKP